MSPYYLYYFSTSDGEREFVVVSDQGQAAVLAEHSEDADLVSAHEIHGDCTSLPCDRALSS